MLKPRFVATGLPNPFFKSKWIGCMKEFSLGIFRRNQTTSAKAIDGLVCGYYEGFFLSATAQKLNASLGGRLEGELKLCGKKGSVDEKPHLVFGNSKAHNHLHVSDEAFFKV
jgi:hypothetical protein